MMQVKGLLAIGLKYLRDQYEYYAMCKAINNKKDVDALDEALAYTKYRGALDLLAIMFQVDKWYLDKLRANNDVILVLEGHYALLLSEED